MDFYSYLWLREDGTPYYAGKGTGRRAFILHLKKGGRKVLPPTDQNRIVIFTAETESEAFAHEQVFIDLFGRKDQGGGVLRNLTDGGEGQIGLVHSALSRVKMSESQKGHPSRVTAAGIEKAKATKLARKVGIGNKRALGTKRTEAQKLAISIRMKKEWDGNLARRHKTAMAMVGKKHALGMKHTEEWKKAKSESMTRWYRDRTSPPSENPS